MKKELHLILAFSLLYFISQVSFAQMADPRDVQIKTEMQMSIRTALFPDWRTPVTKVNSKGEAYQTYEFDPEINEFLNKITKIARAALDHDLETFNSYWSNMNERLKRFLAAEIDASTGQTIFHLLSLKRENANQENALAILEQICPYKVTQKFEFSFYTYEGLDTADYLYGNTALTLALNNELFKLGQGLLNCGANPNKVNAFTGESPLMLSALFADHQSFDALIEAGADHWAKTKALGNAASRGVYWYLNKGRSLGAFDKDSVSYYKIKSWLDQNGHDFQTEALIPCQGFSAQNFIRSRESYFVPFSESMVDQRSSYTFQLDTKRQAQKDEMIKAMQEKLMQDCQNYGYESCTIISQPKMLGEVVTRAEKILLTGEEGALYYGLNVFYAGVMGSADGNPDSCKSN